MYSGEPTRKRRKILLRLQLSSLATISFLIIAGIVSCYIWGVMKGRQGNKSIVAVEKNPLSLPVNERGETVLAPEDLEFARVLRGKLPVKEEKPLKEVDQPVTPQPEENKPAPVATNQDMTQTGETSAAQDAREEMFDYVFQVGAFKDEKSADTLRQELEGRGVRTTLEKSGKVMLVLARARGTSQREKEIHDIAESLKLGKPLLRSRKPVKVQ